VQSLELKNRIITAFFLLAGFLGLLWCSSTFAAGRFLLVGLSLCMIVISILEWASLSTDSTLLSRRRLSYTLLPLILVSISLFALLDSRVIKSWNPTSVNVGDADSSTSTEAVSADYQSVGNSSGGSPLSSASLPHAESELRQFFLKLFLVIVFASWLFSLGLLMLGDRHDVQQVGLMSRELLPAVGLLGVGGASCLLLICLPHGLPLVFFIIATVASCDSAAYFGGRKFQGIKLSPAISPGKTVSGTITGTLAALLVGVIVGGSISLSTTLDLSTVQWFCISGAVAIAAQIGDLTKSYLKRIHGRKDSGKILPGHGGVFDRIDGYLGAAPLLLVAALLFG
jgi:CDP-diglyceride synthetase